MSKIRPYRTTDWKTFIELDLETGRSSMRDATTEQIAKFRQRWPKQIKAIYKWSDAGPTTNNSLLLVLEAEDGDYAGHLWVSEQDDFFSGERQLFITTVALVSKYRGRGWGKLLLQRAEDEARARGLTRMGLGVDATNEDAIALYHRQGFKTMRLSMEVVIDILHDHHRAV